MSKTAEQISSELLRVEEINKKFEQFCKDNNCAIFATLKATTSKDGDPAITSELRIQLITEEFIKEVENDDKQSD